MLYPVAGFGRYELPFSYIANERYTSQAPACHGPISLCWGRSLLDAAFVRRDAELYFRASINARCDSFLCMCTMNAIAKSGVARLTIGIDTKAAMNKPAVNTAV